MASASFNGDYTSRRSIDPALRSIGRVLPRGFALHRGLKVQRALAKLTGVMGRIADVQTAQVNHHVSVRIHRHPGLPERAPALLWIHGGGNVLGTAAQDDLYCRKLAYYNNIAVVSVEHRLAPEHPYPAPVEDCYAALAWLARQSWVDADRLAVGGASAGGHFAAAIAQRARDRGEVGLKLQMLVYPMLDDRTNIDPPGRRRIMWTNRDNAIAWRWYLNGANPDLAVPARCGDLAGLPPAWIGVGTLDLLHDECREYAARLEAAGVEVHQHIAEGAFHAFDQLAPNAPVSLAFFASQCAHLRQALVAGDAAP